MEEDENVEENGHDRDAEKAKALDATAEAKTLVLSGATNVGVRRRG
jgi:hypothetical protein